MRKVIFYLCLIAILGLSSLSSAALIDNGGGFIYDQDLDITWLQSPNNNYMTWQQAKDWATGLTVGGVSGWRLPTALNQNGSGPNSGYNVTGSEMGHLYYTELGNKGFFDVNGHVQLGYGLVNKGPFTNLQSYWYWSTEYAPSPSLAMLFDFEYGAQTFTDKGDTIYALAVHEGNVSPVPIPGALLLFAPCFACLGILRRRIHFLFVVLFFSFLVVNPALADILGGNDLLQRNVVDKSYGISFIDLAHRINSDGLLTSWSIYAVGNGAMQVELKIFRENGNYYDLVGSSPIENISTWNTTNKFALSNSIAVKNGDIIGWYYPISNGPNDGSGISYGGDGNVSWTEPWGIQPDITGSILKTSFNISESRTYSIQVEGSPVPLPATLLLFGPALAGLGFLRKRFMH